MAILKIKDANGNVSEVTAIKGRDGKSAYEYAQDGGYTGTEEEFSNKLTVPFITPEMYGAKGNGTTDDSAAIQSAINAAGNNTPVYLAKKTYKISSGIIINTPHANFKCDGEIIYDGTDAAVKLEIICNANIYIDRITAANGTALKLDGTAGDILSNNITVNYILASVIGMHLYTKGKSICYNDIHSNIINSTDTGFKVWVDKSYINENRYHFGYIGGGCMKGIWLYANPNSISSICETQENRFLSGSVEGADPNGCAICLENSSNNQFDNFRLQENYGKHNIVFKGVCGGNDFRLSQGYMYRVDTSEMESGSEYNYVRASSVLATSNYACGPVACVSYQHGITYDPSFIDISGLLSFENFPDGKVGLLNGAIPTNLVVDSRSGNNVTYTLASLYSERTSLARGFPLVLQFTSTSGAMVFKDSRGGTIFDNSDCKYRGKTIVVRWAGRDKENSIHIWDIKEVGAEYVTKQEIGDIGSQGHIYDSFPSDEVIQDMPDDTYFTVRTKDIQRVYDSDTESYRDQHTGGVTEQKYRKVTGWCDNICKKIPYTNGNTGYASVVAVNQPFSEILVEKYGIQQGQDSAESNSDIMEYIINQCAYGSIIKFPVGHYFFARPIDLTANGEKHFSLIGSGNHALKNTYVNGGTWLHFENLSGAVIALKASQCTLSDFVITSSSRAAKSKFYDFSVDRDDNEDAYSGNANTPNVTITEEIEGQSTTIDCNTTTVTNPSKLTNYSIGIKTSGQMIIRNIGVMHFYTGIYTETGNVTIHHVSCKRCHYGVSIGNDTKVFDVTGWNVSVALQMRGSISSVTGIRGDSIGTHLVEITGGSRHTLTDLDSDFGLGSVVRINGDISNLMIQGAHGRVGAAHCVRDFSQVKTARDIGNSIKVGECELISVAKNFSLTDAVINTNHHSRVRPFDNIEDAYAPSVLLGADTGSTVNNVHFVCTSTPANSDELKQWTLAKIKSLSSVANVKLDTSIGYSIYNHLDNIEEVITSSYATQSKASKDSFDPTVYGLPVLYLTGDTSAIKVSKDNKVNLTYVYGERSGSCTLKGQGATSYKAAQALGDKGKFNYTINFDNPFEAKEGWGSQKKYCLKANYIDHSHARNIVSARLWGLIVKNRKNVDANLKNLVNGGAVDGFPIVIMLNGEFHGLYTWNIPKDGWMFGLVEDTTKQQAFLGANDHETATQFKGELAGDESDFELEFVSDKKNSGWVTTSLNRCINACVNSTGADLDTTVAQYLDWDSAIDYFIWIVVCKGTDMVDKNYLITTFDGVKWLFSAYDMDSTYGLNWDGSGLTRAVSNVNFEECASTHRVWELIRRFKTNALKARYAELRKNVLSETRICNYFETFAWDIPSPVALEDVKKYSTIRGSFVNGIDQICRWVRQRLEQVDTWINALSAQETPSEPDAPVATKNWVEYAVDTDGQLYNGVGYKDNTRLSSSGSVSDTPQTDSVTTGFIPFKNTDVIRIKGAEWLKASENYTGHYYLNLYDSNKTFLASMASSAYETDFATQVSVTYDETTGVTSFSIINPTGNTGAYRTAAQDASYFRITAYGKGANLVVTINQEIPEEGVVSYNNLVPKSIDTDGSIYGGVGYKNNIRLSSSGSISGTSQSDSVTTGFMPWKSCGVIRIQGAKYESVDGKHYYISFYNDSKELYSTYSFFTPSDAGIRFDYSYDEATGVTTIDFSRAINSPTSDWAKGVINGTLFRMTLKGQGSSDLIVTVNQEITD